MKIRNIEVRLENADCAGVGAAAIVREDPALPTMSVRSAKAPGKPAELPVYAAGPKGISDERSVRSAYAGVLESAVKAGLPSIAIPALGCGEGGLSAVASGKILAQELIRLARSDCSRPSDIIICVPDAEAFRDVERAVSGYIRHFLDVLLWGPFVTVDAIIEVAGAAAAATGAGAASGIVLIRRSNPPFGFALPGGFVDYGESLEDAVRREAMEETGLELLDLRQFHTYSDPGRDARFHTVTTVFSARAEGIPRAGDDAAAVRVVGPDEIEGLAFAFDHKRVLEDFLRRRETRR